ncbi:MAG: hypothetical protein ACRDVN_11945 [Jiangellaceae bacterium]
MSEQTPVDSGYRPGDVANGHVLTGSGEWMPVQPAPASGAADVPTSMPEDVAPRRRGRAIVLAVVGIVAILVAVVLSNGGDGDTSDSTAVQGSSSGDVAPAPAADAVDDEAAVVDGGPFVEITALEWEAIARDPDAHAGERIVVFAEVTQFDSATGNDVLRANAGATQPTQTYELETNTIIVADSSALASVSQDDVLRLEAVVDGVAEYETMIGGSTVAPQLHAASVQNVGFLDITGDAVLGDPTTDEFGYLTVPVTITNSGTDTFTYWVDVAAVNEDGTEQYETTSAFAENLAPGQSKTEELSFYEDVPADAALTVVKVERSSA